MAYDPTPEETRSQRFLLIPVVILNPRSRALLPLLLVVC